MAAGPQNIAGVAGALNEVPVKRKPIRTDGNPKPPVKKKKNKGNA